MNTRVEELFQIIAVQHLWQSAVLFFVVTAMFKVYPLKPGARSWIWLGVLTLAALLPLTVFAPDSARIHAAPLIARIIEAPVLDKPAIVHPTTRLADSSSGTQPSISSARLRQAIVLVWLLGTIWHLLGLWRGWRTARFLRLSAVDMDRLQTLMRQESGQNYTIKACNGIASPMAVGLLHPCILVPRAIATDLPDANLIDVLNHEIAHLRRGDLWVSIVQRLLTAIYWWSPVFRLIGAQLELAREMACDEQAIMRSGQPKAYAKSLLACVDIVSQSGRRNLLSSPMFGSRKALTRRIEELVHVDPAARKSRHLVSSIFWGVGMTAVVSATYAGTPRVGDTNGRGLASAVAALPSGGTTKKGPSDAVDTRRLLEATHAGHVDVVRGLVGRGADIDAGVDGDGTALIVAARDGNLPMVDALLGMGAKVDAAWPGDGTPLIAAVISGKLEIVRQILAAGANPNAVSTYDETPLINAVRAGRFDAVQYLVEHGADVNLGVWADGRRWRTPLNQASSKQVKAYLLGKGAI